MPSRQDIPSPAPGETISGFNRPTMNTGKGTSGSNVTSSDVAAASAAAAAAAAATVITPTPAIVASRSADTTMRITGDGTTTNPKILQSSSKNTDIQSSNDKSTKDDDGEVAIFDPTTHCYLPSNTHKHRFIGDYTSQSERKKQREKKRRQEISVAIDRLSKMLLKLDPSKFIQHNSQLYHFTDNGSNSSSTPGQEEVDPTAPTFPPRQVTHHPLNRTDIINHAVVMLEKLARQSEESKIELLQVQHSMMMANKYTPSAPTPSAAPVQPQQITTAAIPHQTISHQIASSNGSPMQPPPHHAQNFMSMAQQQVIVGNNQQQIITAEVPVSNSLVMMSAAPASNIVLTGPPNMNYVSYAPAVAPQAHDPQRDQQKFYFQQQYAMPAIQQQQHPQPQPQQQQQQQHHSS